MSLELASHISAPLLYDIGAIIVLATGIAYFAKFFKQPLIPAYVIAGIILGPLGIGLISDHSVIIGLSEIGIAFLLFIVGLEIDLKKLKRVGVVSVFGGITQVFLTFVFGFILAFFLKFSYVSSVYLGLILAFSSTMVVIKLLSDEEKLDTLHGRIILGILIVQDLLVILALSILKTFTAFSFMVLLASIFKGILLLFIAIFISKFLLPHFFRFVANSDELFFLSAISVCFLFSLVAYLFGFSVIIGAFIAGVGLASLPYNINIIGRVTSLKDFFATIFFVSLGMQLVLIGKEFVIPLILLSLFVVLFKPLIIMVITSLFGYERHVSFLTSISLGQISEFSLVMVTLGYYTLSQVSQQFFSMVVFLTIITIVITSYLIKHDDFIYLKLSRFLKIFEKLSIEKKKFEYVKKDLKHRTVLFGCHRMGSIILNRLSAKNVFVVDHNPETIYKLMDKKVSCMYGDAANVEVLNKIRLSDKKLLISTIPNVEDNLFLIDFAKNANPQILVFVTADHVYNALDLYEKGADYVILPHILSGKKIASIIDRAIKSKPSVKSEKKRHLAELLKMDMIGY